MAGPAAEVVFTARVPGADGAYTDQMVVKVDERTVNGWWLVAHDLKRIPDWARATKLTYGIAVVGPATAPFANLAPAINVAASITAGRLVWDSGINDGGASGRPPVMAPGQDLTNHMWFGAAGDFVPDPPGPDLPGQDAYYLVEVGITHSKSK